MRLKRGELDVLWREEASAAIREGVPEGLAQMRAAYRSALAAAATPAGRRDRKLQRHARELRQMKRAGLF